MEIIEAHENFINKVIQKHFCTTPSKILRMTTGICNEVYTAVLDDREVIVRLSLYNKFLMGSHNNIPLFKKLGLKVPEILAEDYSKTLIPYSYQIQSKIEGCDIGEVINQLTDEQLNAIAKEISNVFLKVATIPSSQNFGVVWDGENEFSDTWTERMKIWTEETVERGRKTGIMNNEMRKLAEGLYADHKIYFDSVKPVTYFGDISSKNVMVFNGKFNGLVDLDGLTQGDYLEAVGRIQASWFGTHYGEIYTNAVMDELKLSNSQKKIVRVYAIMNRISWTCENGIQFNQNTKPVVNWEADKENKKVIKLLANGI